MLAPALLTLTGAAALATALWVLAAARPSSVVLALARLATLGSALLLTWRVVALNRAGLALPADALSPAVAGWAAVLPTFAWAVAVTQPLTWSGAPRPVAQLPPAFLTLTLLLWPRVPLFTRLPRVYGGDGRAFLLLGLALACSAVAASGAVALLERGMVGAGAPLAPRFTLGGGALGAAVALAALARQVTLARAPWSAAATWLVVLAAAHGLAAVSVAARRGRSTAPAVVALWSGALLVLYLLLATLGRIAGA